MEWSKEKWASYQVVGDPCFRLAKKLKMLKEDLKKWNREVFGNINVRVEQALEELRFLDGKEGENLRSSEDIVRREAVRVELRRLLISEEICWRQKSRIQWLKEGDNNKNFFHKMANAHKVNNQIHKVRIDGTLLEDGDDMKGGIAWYYQRLYSDSGEWRPTLEGVDFKSLEEADREGIGEPFS